MCACVGGGGFLASQKSFVVELLKLFDSTANQHIPGTWYAAIDQKGL